MKQGKSRMLLIGLVLMLLVSVLSVQTLAAEPAGSFYLTAETKNGLIFAPEKVSYTQGQTIREALLASGHKFDMGDDDMVYAIDGVSAGFIRSDETGEFDMRREASAIEFFCFSERRDGRPSEARQQLTRTMVLCKEKPADVQQAVKAAYEAAYEGFTAADDEELQRLDATLTQAMADYEREQNDTRTVTVTGTDGAAVTAVNVYGKTFEGIDQTLELPVGAYDLTVVKGHLRSERKLQVSGNITVDAALPTGGWLNASTVAVSTDYGDEAFEAARLTLQPNGAHGAATAVADAFGGKLYFFGERTEATPENAEFYAVYRDAFSKESRMEKLPFASRKTGVSGVLKQGSDGNTLALRVSAPGPDGVVRSEDYTIELARVPSLTDLKLTEPKNGKEIDQAATELFRSSCLDYTYKILDKVKTIRVWPKAYGEDYGVAVNGIPVGPEGYVELDPAEHKTVEVTVESGAYTTTYVLHVERGTGKNISFRCMEPGTTLVVTNRNDIELPCAKELLSNGCYRYVYTLVPNEDYTYVATNDVYYHAAKAFSISDTGNTGMEVRVKKQNGLQSLALGRRPNDMNYALTEAFSPETHLYTALVPDTELNVWVDAVQQSGEVEARYTQISNQEKQDGVQAVVPQPAPPKKPAMQLRTVLMTGSGRGNDVTIRVSSYDAATQVTWYQDYVIQLRRTLSLNLLEVLQGEDRLPMERPNPDQPDQIRISVPYAVQELTLRTSLPTGQYKFGEKTRGYHVTVNGQALPEEINGNQKTVAVPVMLSGTLDTETIEVVVTNDFAGDASRVYTIKVMKAAPVFVGLQTEPAGAQAALYEHRTQKRVWPVEGEFQLSEGADYDYTVALKDYIGQQGTLKAEAQNGELVLLVDGEPHPLTTDPATGRRWTQLSVTLTRAPVNETLKLLPSQWSDFRGTQIQAGGTLAGAKLSNNSVIDYKTPYVADDGVLYWTRKMGESWLGVNAPGCPIVVDDDLVLYAGTGLYKVDAISGEILAQGTMARASSFAINPPTYSDGMIFVALSDGGIQAFDAATLESLWVYNDPLKGQSNCPIVVRSGYLYTGFWGGETKNANFVCLPITDEDPTDPMEQKTAAWTFMAKGGFYWAGAYVSDEYVLIGTDDGVNGYVTASARMMLLDVKTGKVLDQWTGLLGDIRSSVTYDEQTDAFYFASKGGLFYSMKVQKLDGRWRITDQWSVQLENGTEAVPMSTSTPVVYKGRAYIGVSGSSQFGAYCGHNITVIDLTTRSIAYRAQTQGYPQTSGLLSTAYEETGEVYIYFLDNMTPGKLRVLRDRPGQTRAEYVTTEDGMETAYALFTPVGEQEQFCICSPVVDAYGTFYFKNDSGYLMAFGSRIEKIEITAQPEKLTYQRGEAFDPAGMVVTATYVNGLTRDVTPYVTIKPDSFEAIGTQTVTVSFPYGLYHNVQEGTEIKAGVTVSQPYVTLEVRVEEKSVLSGDANGDGEVNALDAVRILQYAAQLREDLPFDEKAADVNGDGRINTTDAVRLLQDLVQLP